MKRIYAYKGFEVTVDLEPVGHEGVWFLRPRGFVSFVRVRSAGVIGDAFAPTSLMADGQRPFLTEAEAFMAGHSAAQRLIDNAVVL